MVCVGNVCRSALGERLLAARLPDTFSVSSAGIAALEGHPMEPETAALALEYGATPDGFTARQLTPAMVASSDLVLTATREIRSQVLEEAPSALRRTFTVLEYAALLDLLEGAATPMGPPALTRAAAAERSRAVLESYDIADPYRRDEAVHAEMARTMAAAVDRIVKGLTR